MELIRWHAPHLIVGTSWTVITLCWLVQVASARTREQRALRFRRLPVWWGIAGLEGALYASESATAWLVALGACAALSQRELGHLYRLPSWLQIAVPLSLTGLVLALRASPLELLGLMAAALITLFACALRATPSARSICFAGGSLLFLLPPLSVYRMASWPGLNTDLYVALSGVHFVDILSGFAGKRGLIKPLPRLSPNKTLRGFAAGLVTALGFATIANFVLTQRGLAASASLGATLFLGAVLGDLAASKLKRVVLAKDFGDALGAHGGVADRIDSACPVIAMLCLLSL